MKVAPRELKKHSQVVRKRESSIVIIGNREKTDTGYVISGHSGKNIETFFETLLPGAASAVMMHPKKERVLTILSGGGFVVLKDGDGEATDRRVYPGDEIIIKAGVSYRLATTSDQALEMHVSQESKYAVNMQILEEAASTVSVAQDLLSPAERAAYIPPGAQIRRGSKAKQQQERMLSRRVPTGQVFSGAGSAVMSAADSVAKEGPIMNARPSMGRFDEAGAG